MTYPSGAAAPGILFDNVVNFGDTSPDDVSKLSYFYNMATKEIQQASPKLTKHYICVIYKTRELMSELQSFLSAQDNIRALNRLTLPPYMSYKLLELPYQFEQGVCSEEQGTKSLLDALGLTEPLTRPERITGLASDFDANYQKITSDVQTFALLTQTQNLKHTLKDLLGISQEHEIIWDEAKNFVCFIAEQAAQVLPQLEMHQVQQMMMVVKEWMLENPKWTVSIITAIILLLLLLCICCVCCCINWKKKRNIRMTKRSKNNSEQNIKRVSFHRRNSLSESSSEQNIELLPQPISRASSNGTLPSPTPVRRTTGSEM